MCFTLFRFLFSCENLIWSLIWGGKKASETVFMIEFEPLWEGKLLTDGQCEQYFTCSLARLNLGLLSVFISKAITESMWTQRIVALDNHGVKPPYVRFVFRTTSILTD